jgi:2-methylcitrate dehydratase
MTHAEQLATFVVGASYDDLSEAARQQLKIRVLDGLGCAIGALNGEPIRLLKMQIEEFGGSENSTLIGGGKTSPDRAAFYNSALVRYLDTWRKVKPVTPAIISARSCLLLSMRNKMAGTF